jgi:ABC-type transporter Mla MlaB component
MLKITIETEETGVALKLEGELTGTWVRDLETSWRLVAGASSARALPVRVDLADCSRVDEAGQYLLALLHLNGTRLVARGVAMTELVASLTKEWPFAAQGVTQCA